MDVNMIWMFAAMIIKDGRKIPLVSTLKATKEGRWNHCGLLLPMSVLTRLMEVGFNLDGAAAPKLCNRTDSFLQQGELITTTLAHPD